MLRFGLPAVAWAGAALALVPLLLHLLTRRPGEPRPLPTARFLTPRPRLRLRLRRRPEDPGLLLLRILLLLLVAGAFAGPRWTEPRRGVLEVVLLDAGEGMAPAWAEAVALAGVRVGVLGGPQGTGEAGGEAGGAGSATSSLLVLFDTVPRFVPGKDVTSAFLKGLLDTGPAPGVAGEYAMALAALEELPARFPSVDSVRVTLVTRPRWEGWSPGLAARREAWPGRIALLAVEGGDVRAASTPGGLPTPGPSELPEGFPGAGADLSASGRGTAVVVARAAHGFFVEAALGALGWRVVREDPSPPPGGGPGALGGSRAEVYVVLEGAPVEGSRLRGWAEGGATVVVSAVAEGRVLDDLPWVAGGAVVPGSGDLVLDGGSVVRGAARRGSGGPAEGALLLAVWNDGLPAAAALARGEGCLVYLDTPLEEGRLPLDPAFPTLLRRLTAGCAPPAAALPPGPLDRGARQHLEAPEAPSSVALGTLVGGDLGRPLARWFLAAALIVALVEGLVARKVEVRRGTVG